MTVIIGRRTFAAALAGAATAPLFTPRVARAQQAMPVVGFLHPASPGTMPNANGFVLGLRETGHIDGQNVVIEYRWAESQPARLPALAADLVARRAAVIAVGGGRDSILAARNATRSIPIVFFTGSDPVADGLVESFNRPGGNLTGAYVLVNTLVAKQLQVLRELLPGARSLAALDNSGGGSAAVRVRSLKEAALALGVDLQLLDAASESDIEAAFAALAAQRVRGLVLAPDPFLSVRREQVAALGIRHGIAVIGSFPEHPAAGCLMSYGPNLVEGYRLVGNYTGRVLKGAHPAELPVQQSVKVELVINLKTAKALGLTVPLALLGRADEVIE